MRRFRTLLRGNKLYSHFKYGECPIGFMTNRLIPGIVLLVVHDRYHSNSSFAKGGGGRERAHNAPDSSMQIRSKHRKGSRGERGSTPSISSVRLSCRESWPCGCRKPLLTPAAGRARRSRLLLRSPLAARCKMADLSLDELIRKRGTAAKGR